MSKVSCSDEFFYQTSDINKKVKKDKRKERKKGLIPFIS